jgi:hypothetical protein
VSEQALLGRKWIADGHWVIGAEIGLAAMVGTVLLLAGVGGGAWILGGIIAGAIAFWQYRDRVNPHAQPNRNARKMGQMLVGLAVGFSLQHSQWESLSVNLPLFLLLTLCLLVGGGAIGYFYSRYEKIDLLTALLATTPGNLGVMGSIAADYGCNASLVSLVQLLRFTIVTLLIPLVAHVSRPDGADDVLQRLIPPVVSLDGWFWLWLVAVLAAARAAVQLGTRCKIPVAALLCAIAVGLFFNPTVNAIPFLPMVDYGLPPLLGLLGQILLGVTIGEFWAANPKLSTGTIVRANLPVVLTLIAGLGTAAIAKLLTPWDWLTCLLVAAPGGSPEMIWIALSLHHNVEIVTAGHLLRLIAINLSLPTFVALATYLDQKTAHFLAESPSLAK